MPKNDFLSPKAISNRIKSKGLQKLRWYCEMCQKQCRDENGFKCHQTSEGHLRQMRIFAENPDDIMNQYSEEFEADFLEVLSRRHGTKRVRANLVYNEFIADKQHTHMNATRWETLTTFVQYLGKAGKCTVDETEKGWYVQWIDRDPRLLAMQEAANKRKKAELDDEERQAKIMAQQVREAREREQQKGPSANTGPTELNREEGAAAVRIQVKASSLADSGRAAAKRPRWSAAVADVFGGVASGSGAGAGGGVGAAAAAAAGGGGKGGKMSAMEKLMAQGLQKKAQEQAERELEEREKAEALAAAKKAAAGVGGRKDYWLHTGVVVKVVNKKLQDGAYYKKKGRVRKVVERYVAEVKMLDSGDRLRIDQDDLETVIPAVGGEVLVVNGPCRGCRAKLLSLDTDAFCARVEVQEGEDRGRVLEKVEYEDICKLVDA